jgi:hypothetical protein
MIGDEGLKSVNLKLVNMTLLTLTLVNLKLLNFTLGGIDQFGINQFGMYSLIRHGFSEFQAIFKVGSILLEPTYRTETTGVNMMTPWGRQL